MAKRSQGARNKQIGHDAERYYVNVFKQMGFEFCVTARLASRLYDNAKVDLVNLPFNLQIKAGQQTGLNPGKELFSMESAIKALFPPNDDIHNRPAFLIHKKPAGRGNKNVPENEIVYMSYKQYQDFLITIPDLKFTYEKIFKFESTSDFKHIVGMTFEIFSENIIKKVFLNGSNNNTSSTD